jgi:hypothetical protein
MDIKAELKRMEAYKSEEYLKLSEGRHELVFIGEPIDDEFITEDGERKPQAVFDVQLNGEAYKWSVTKSLSKKGVFYDLCKAAKGNNYSFNGLYVKISVTGVGRQKSYTVITAKNSSGDEVY